MAIITPWAMDAIGDPDDPDTLTPKYTAANLRHAFTAALGQGSTATNARSGVLSGLDVSVIDDVVYISAGLIVVTTADGSFVTGLDAEYSVPLVARDATNPRRDLVVVQIHHDAVSRSATVEVIPGTPAPSPAAPSVPVGAEVLGIIDVPSATGSASVYTARHSFTAARGGSIVVPSVSNLDRIADPSHGLEVVSGSGSKTAKWMRVGGSWVRTWEASSGQPFAFSSGSLVVSGDGSEEGRESVTFPSGRFTRTPNIVVSAAGNARYNAVAGSSSSSGFDAVVRHVEGISFSANVNVRWVAIQMAEDDSDG